MNSVVSSSKLRHIVDVASQVWDMQPIRDVRMPELGQEPVTINALWTDYGLRPNSNNLAFLVHEVRDVEDLEQWKRRLREWPVRGGLLVSEELYLFQAQSCDDEVEPEILDFDAWRETLVSPKNYLFTPKALSEFRVGQLSLADFEETVSEQSLTFLLRQRSQLDEAFQGGIDAALREIEISKGAESSRNQIKGHVIRMAIGYLAARILEDKNFFGPGHSIQVEDPLALLERMVVHTNGFFRKAKESAQCVNERVRQALAAHMGYSVSFVLTDQRDVGRLYERAIKKLPRDLGSEDWGDLNRHYTPVAIAERMLELLPLERLRPEERFIIDPAAGSGSLLLAATSRLAQMSDIPTNARDRNTYLSRHVVGNDLDRYAHLVAQLRYFLASESLGISGVLPFPHFTHENYEVLNKENIRSKTQINPRVVVANPPFDETGDKQLAAEFIKHTVKWLNEGSQFAFVLPQSFLTNTTHGVSAARKLIYEDCQIFDVWQLPEGSIGVEARQPVCIILGSIGKVKTSISLATTSRKIVSGAGVSDIRESGFLGFTWLSKAYSENDYWKSLTNPVPAISVPTVPLASLFYIFAGVTLKTEYPPVATPSSDGEYKRYWRLGYRDKGRLWANPARIDPLKRWLKYGSEYLRSPQLKNAKFFASSKVLVGRSVNSNSKEPLAAHFDTEGLCPDDHIFCILPAEEVQKHNKGYTIETVPLGWRELTWQEQKLWLLGILSSTLLTELSLAGRNVRQITKDALSKLPLPLEINPEIIEVTRQLVERDQNDVAIPDPDNLRAYLDELVRESYGSPFVTSIERTGVSSSLQAWRTERQKITITVIGQVLDISADKNEILLYVSGLLDEQEDAWVPLPQELPGWALTGAVFEAELSADIETFEELAKRPWALRRFRHTPRPYLVDDELGGALRIESLEMPL